MLRCLSVIFLLTFFTPFFLSAKDDLPDWLNNRGLEYGINFGVYFPNSYTANYYNGSSSVNNLENIIGQYQTSNTGPDAYYTETIRQVVHPQIRDAIGAEYHILELPQHMRYAKPLNMGFYTKYSIKPDFAFFLEFNYSELTTTDKFSIQTENQASGSFDPDHVYFYNIKGRESRYDINLGIYKSFGPVSVIRPYVEAAFNMNNTHVVSADVNIKGSNYDLTYSFLNPYNEYYHIRDYGVGFGGSFGGGVQLVWNEKIAIYTGVNLAMKHIKIGDFPDVQEYPGYKINSVVYARLLFRNLMHAPKK